MAQQRSHMMPVHFAPHHHDTARRARRSGLVLMRGGLPQEVEEEVNKFKKVYPRAQIQTLWTKLKQVYGTESLAIQGIRRNPQIINPSYSYRPNALTESKKVLLEYMSEEEAIDVMLKNPSVLQCGERGLRSVGPDEIKGFANILDLGSKLPFYPLLGGFLGLCAFNVYAANVDAAQAAALAPFSDLLKPLVGIVFAVAIEGSRVAIVGAVVKNQMEGKEFGVDKYGKRSGAK